MDKVNIGALGSCNMHGLSTGMLIYILSCVMIWSFVLIFKVFSPWDQVLEIEGGALGQSLYDLIAMGHPHSIRYAVVWPVFFMAREVGLDNEVVFGWYVGAFLCGAALYNVKSVSAGIKLNGEGYLISTAVFAVLSLCALFMNGRGVIAFFGVAITVNAVLDILNRLRLPLIKMPIGIMVSSVSSGTLMVSLSVILISMAMVLFRCVLCSGYIKFRAKKTIAIFGAMLTIVSGLFGWLLYALVDKGLAFYDYSIVEMAGHGLGVVISSGGNAAWLILACGIGFAALLPLILPVVIRGASVLSGHGVTNLSLVVGCVVCGFFGFTALAMVIPMTVTIVVVIAIRSIKPIIADEVERQGGL